MRAKCWQAHSARRFISCQYMINDRPEQRLGRQLTTLAHGFDQALFSEFLFT